MSVEIGDPGFYYLLTEKQALEGDQRPWYNQYTLASNAGFTLGAVDDLAEAFGIFESKIHLEGVRVNRILLSTFDADSNPYNPYSFAKRTINVEGLRPTATQPVERRICARVVKTVATGFDGSCAYRGALVEGDLITTPGSKYGPFEPTDAYYVLFTNSLADISQYFGDSGTPPLRLVLVSLFGGSYVARNLLGMVPDKPTIVSDTHAWYDRP